MDQWEVAEIGLGDFGLTMFPGDASYEQAEAALQAISDCARYKSQVERMLVECGIVCDQFDVGGAEHDIATRIRAAANRSESE